MRRTGFLLAGAVFVGLVGCAPLKPQAAATCAPSPNFAHELLDAVNADRAAAGVEPVVWDQGLADSAQAWAEHMAATNNPYIHSRETGENQIGRWPCQTATEVEAAFMASAGHRPNIVAASHTRLGVGWTVNGLGLWVVQQFDQ
jgi:uncharacterized protein YkwD